ncbi:hypothetical protein BH10PSE14_BH10PSE14_42970 [soil metagenome]
MSSKLLFLLGIDVVIALAFATILLAWRRFVSPHKQPRLSAAEKLAAEPTLSPEDREAVLAIIASIGADPFAPPLAPGARLRQDFFLLSCVLWAATLLEWLWSWSAR